jgi:hypothetical protein
MSYTTIAANAADSAFTVRARSAAVQEGHTSSLTVDYIWSMAAAQDIEAAYESALAAGNPNPGGDEAVITDGMILAYVQTNPPVAS